MSNRESAVTPAPTSSPPSLASPGTEIPKHEGAVVEFPWAGLALEGREELPLDIVDRRLDASPLAAAKSASIATQVRALLAADLRRGQRDSGSIARRLHISRRTLVRRLKMERTSFSEQLDSLRNDAALRLLASTSLSLHDISKLLGFSHVQAFHRAFRRWAGLTPSAYRATAQDIRASEAPRPHEPHAIEDPGPPVVDEAPSWSAVPACSSEQAGHDHEP